MFRRQTLSFGMAGEGKAWSSTETKKSKSIIHRFCKREETEDVPILLQ